MTTKKNQTATKAKTVKKATSKKEKDEKKEANKTKIAAGYTLSTGIEESSYRSIKDRSYNSFFSAIFGTPGFVKGKIYEFAGKSDVGKTALCGKVTGLFQKQGEQGFVINAEGALNAKFAKELGIDTKNLLHVRPEYGEAGFAGLKEVLANRGGQFGFLDSTASMKPKAQMEEDKNDMGASARLSAMKMPAIENLVEKVGATLILISQIKEKPGVSFGNPEYVSGGSAYGFHSRVRLRLSQVAVRRDEKTKQQTGYTVRIKVTKNHTAAKRTTPFDLIVDNMFRPLMAETAVVWAKQFKLLDEAGSKICGIEWKKEKGQSKDDAIAAAIAGKEYLVFEAVDGMFKEAEAGNGILEFITFEDTEEDSSNLDEDGFDEVEVSAAELDEAGAL